MPPAPSDDGSPRTDDFHAFTTADRFNFLPFNQILSPNKRVAIYGQGETVLTDNVSFYLKGLFNNRKSTNQAAPERLNTGLTLVGRRARIPAGAKLGRNVVVRPRVIEVAFKADKAVASGKTVGK